MPVLDLDILKKKYPLKVKKILAFGQSYVLS